MKLPQDSTIKSFITMVFTNYPYRSFFVTITLVIAAILEILSLATLLPAILNFANSEETPANVSGILKHINFINDMSITSALIVVSMFMVVRGLFIFLSHYQIGLMAIELERNIRFTLLKNHLKSNWSYQSSTNIGHFVNVITQQSSLCSLAVFQFGHFFIASITAIILLTTSLFISWIAFCIFAVSCIPYLFISRILNNSTHKASKLYNHTLGECSTDVIESTNLSKFYKASGQEDVAINRFRNKATSLYSAHKRLITNKAFLFAYPEVFGIITLSSLIIIVYYLGAIASEELLFFLLIMYRAYTQITRRQTSKNTLVRQIPSFKKVRDQLEKSSTELENTASKEPLTLTTIPNITLENINFSYKEETQTLKNISLSIEPNQIVAFVGKSGSGKSSLIDCITYINTPSSGRILVNNANVSLYDLLSYRSLFAYVPQDSSLISGTISENILLLADDKSEDNLIKAAKLSGIHDFIQSLERGYDTAVDGTSTTLSGGQRQRLALARAIAQKPKFLILDEATSALDNQTEASIQESLQNIKKEATIIMIAHKISSVKKADNIFVLDDGMIIQSGMFNKLIEQEGLFKELYQLT